MARKNASENRYVATAKKWTLLEQQLQAANQQLTSSNQQLRASSNQLKSANQQLRVTEQQLMASNQQLRASECKLKELNYNLNERVKELRCVFAVSNLAVRTDLTIDSFLQGIATILPAGWQYPEITRTRIVFNGKEYVPKKFKRTSWKQVKEIRLFGKKVGLIEVYYIKKRPKKDDGPFFKEERKLLNLISEEVSKAIERMKNRQEVFSLSKFPGEDLNPVCRVSKEGVLLYANDACKKQISKGKIKIGAKVPEHWLNIINRVYRTGKRHEMEEAIDEKMYIFDIVPITGQGYTNIYARDITERKKAEQELENSREEYIDLFETMQEGYAAHEMHFDTKGKAKGYRFLKANKSFERLTGLRVNEIIGKSVHEVLPNIEPFWIETYANVVRTGKPVTFDNYSKELDTWYNVSAFRIRKNQFGTVFSDITAHKKMEASLIASEVRYRRLFEAAKDGILILDFNTGMIVDVNPFLTTLLGFKREEIIMKRVWEIGLLKDLIMNKENYLELQKKEYVRYEDLPLQAKDGRSIEVEFVSNVYNVGNQKVIQCNIRDISERKKAEEKLMKSERSLKRAEAIAHVGNWTWHIRENKLEWSDEMYRIFGIDRATFTGNIEDVIQKAIHPDDREAVMNSNKKVLEEGIAGIMEYRVVWPDGSVHHIWAEPADKVLDEKGTVVRLSGIIQDITERKKMEDEQLKNQKMESIALLAGGIAHDFNNLLTQIMGNINLMKIQTGVDKALAEIASDAEKGCLMATSLTSQLLTFAKGGEPVKEKISIAELVKNAATFVLSGSHCKLVFTAEEKLRPVEVDAGQITQAIQNIVINAKQAMPMGGTIRIVLENIVSVEASTLQLPSGDYVKVVIQDQGPGIPGNHMKKVFDPYFTTKQTGSGLGLAVVYSIVKKHGGRVSVYSELGKGTAFHLYLPAASGWLEPVTRDESKIEKGAGRILVMDDEEQVRMVLGRMLARIGYEVVFTQNGEEAISMYKDALQEKKAFDAVILDLTVQGGMGGRKTLEEVQKIDPGVRAIASSGYSDDDTAAEHKAIGFKGFLGKPYTTSKLSMVLKEVVEKK